MNNFAVASNNLRTKRNEQSRADRANSWRASYPSNLGAYPSYDNLESDKSRPVSLSSIWGDDYSNTFYPSYASYPYQRNDFAEGSDHNRMFDSSQYLSIDNQDINQMVSQDHEGTAGVRPLFYPFSPQTSPAPLSIDTRLSNVLYNNPVLPSVQEEQMSYNDNAYLFAKGFTWSQIAAQVELYDNQDSSNTSPTTPQAVKYLSSSHFAPSLHGSPNFNPTPPTRPYTVLRIQNIPWAASTDEIKEVLKQSFTMPPTKELPLSVHMLMDKTTGKSNGIAFAEVITSASDTFELREILAKLERKCRLRGRRLTINPSNYDQLRKELFPDWPGQFKDGMVIPLTDNLSSSTSSSNLFVNQRDFQNIQNVCRNYKACYNRKCPERSFEYLMSLLMNIPWLQSNAVITWQRDLMYECCKLITGTLRTHMSKSCHIISAELLPRLVRTALLCDGFTIKQKATILATANIPCPDDLLSYITEEVETSSGSSSLHYT